MKNEIKHGDLVWRQLSMWDVVPDCYVKYTNKRGFTYGLRRVTKRYTDTHFESKMALKIETTDREIEQAMESLEAKNDE